ncbi:MAG: Ig-like domain-containing protein [Limnohabitans sp.]|uniref:Ig-like domain-containing protein n=1 Tax=Limnohabitans sp. TaxID=1907725 RepID=UPI003BB0DE58
MKNSYKVVVKTNQGNAKTVTHDVPAPGSWWGALKIKAVPGARYQLIDNTTGQGPDNIRVKRTGNDLRISFDGREDADLVISNYYEYTEPGFAALIGEADPGVFHAYLPESGQTSALVGNLPDGASDVGMALGGEQVGASGAAVGALVAVAGFNPLLAAPLALLGVGGGGGGTDGGGVPDTTRPNISAVRLAPEDDTGVSNSDGITADKTPKLLITADPDAVSATVTLMNGKIYTSTTKNAQGQFVVQVDTMPDGKHPFSVQVKDAAGNQSQPFEGAFTVDTSASDNYSPGAAKDLNQGVKVSIDAIEADTGLSATDFITQDSTLKFKGSLDAFSNNGAHVQLFLYDEKNVLVATQYSGPALASPYAWTWDLGASQSLSGGRYSLEAQLTDLAGNVLSTKVKQSIVIVTQADPAGFDVGLSKLTLQSDRDSGKYNTDFLTNRKDLVFTGELTGFLKSQHKLLMEVVNADGKLVSSAFVEPDNNGQWQYGNSWGEEGKTVNYVIKSSVVDLAGNIFKSKSQSFVVDREIDEIEVLGGQNNVFDQITFKASEAGEFFLDQISYENGLTFVGNQIAAGFSLSFKDLAGNVTTLENGGPWQITNLQAGFKKGASPAEFVNSTDKVGSYQLDANQNALDLSSLDSLVPRVGDQVAINHVSMRDKSGDDVLTISMGDVLSLGVANSFTKSGHLQMRIDGDLGDRVFLDSFVGSSKALLWSTPLEQSLGSDKYAVYSNASLGLDLLIQQGIVTTVL